MAKELLILSPVKGKVKELKKVDDETFAQEMMGPGIAVTPEEETTEVLAPIKGKIATAFSTGHAYGIFAKPAEILVHIGVDTVNLSGKGFEVKVSEAVKVKPGKVLCAVDMKEIKKAKSTDTIIIITNFKDLEAKGYSLEVVAKGNVEAGDVLFKLVK